MLLSHQDNALTMIHKAGRITSHQQAFYRSSGLHRSPRQACRARCTRPRATKQNQAPLAYAAHLDILNPIPRQIVEEIEEPAARNMIEALQAENISLSGVGTIASTFVGPADKANDAGTPVLLLHGFDGSCIEYRRMKPFLDKAGVQTWALDLLGNGFCASGLEGQPNAELGPEQRRQHLYAFWKQKIGRPMAVVGTSLGGAVAIDFAVAHPEAVDKLVLFAPQVMTDGIGPMSAMPTFFAKLGVKFLQTYWLREKAGSMAYYDKKTYATADAVRIGRVHTFMPGWLDATVAFMKSGGYKVSKKIKDVRQDTLVVWGAKDEILDPKSGSLFAEKLPQSKLVYLDNCGHSVHLEQPEKAADMVMQTIGLKV